MRRQGEYFQGEILSAVRRCLSEFGDCCGLMVSDGFLKDELGFLHEMSIFVGGRDPPPEAGALTVVRKENVLAVAKVYSTANIAGYDKLQFLLKSCGVLDKGFFVGVSGSLRGVKNGENTNLNPKVYFLAPLNLESANVGRKIRMTPRPVHKAVLLHFLEALANQVNGLIP